MKNQMKRIFSTAAVCLFMVAAAAMSGCHKDMKDDIDDLKGEVSKLQKEVSTLDELAKTLDETLKAGKLISGTPESITEGDKTGWLIKFTDGSSIKVWNGTNGSAGTNPGLTITENEDGTITFTINNGGTEKSYTLPMNFVYASGIVIRGTTFMVDEGQTITVPFRVNPSEAVIKEADVHLDAILKNSPTRGFDVVKPDNYELVAGSFKANPTYVGEYSIGIKCIRAIDNLDAALVIDTKDAQGNAMQISSPIFTITKNSTVFTENSLLPIDDVSVFSSQEPEIQLTFSWNGVASLTNANLEVTTVNVADKTNVSITPDAQGKFKIKMTDAAKTALKDNFPYTVALKVSVSQGTGTAQDPKITSTQTMNVTFKSNDYTVNLTESPEWVLVPAANTALYDANILAQIQTALGDNVTPAQLKAAALGSLTTTVGFKALDATGDYSDITASPQGVSASATDGRSANPSTFNYSVAGTTSTTKGYYKVSSAQIFTLATTNVPITVNIVSEYEVNDNKPFEITAPKIVSDLYTKNVFTDDEKITLLTDAFADVTVKVNGKDVPAANVTITFEQLTTAPNTWTTQTEIAQDNTSEATFGKQFDVRAIVSYNGNTYKDAQVVINSDNNAFKATFSRNLLTEVKWLNAATTLEFTTTSNTKTYDISTLIGFKFAHSTPTMTATYKEATDTNDWMDEIVATDVVFENTNINTQCKTFDASTDATAPKIGLQFADYVPDSTLETSVTITFTDKWGLKKTFTMPVKITKPE